MTLNFDFSALTLGVEALTAAAVLSLHWRLTSMSVTLNTKAAAIEAKMDEMILKLQAAKLRDDVHTAAFAEVKAELVTLKGQVAPLPVDTSAAEATMDRILAQMDFAEATADAIDAEPAPAPVAAAPAGVTADAPPTPEAPPSPEAPTA